MDFKKGGFFLRFCRVVLSTARARQVGALGKNGGSSKFTRRLFPKPCRTALFVGLFPGLKIALCAKELASKPLSKFVSSKKDDEILRIADMYYEQNQMQQLFDLLNTAKTSMNPEVIWRLARATYELAKAAKNEEDKKRLTYDAFALSQQALDLDDNNFACHKWFAILLDEIGKYEGIKYRLKRSPEVKEHFERSIELNPRDPTSRHCLGYWHYSFADLAWYQRKAAEAFFASPPKSTYEEAIKCFGEAEEIQPNFYSMNLLMLGKAYYKLGDYVPAALWLGKLKEFQAKTAEDIKAKEEGSDLALKVRLSYEQYKAR